MKYIYNLSLILAFVLVSISADAQLRKIYNEQQLIMLEMNEQLHTIEENQISKKAKKSKVYKRYKKIEMAEEKVKRRKSRKNKLKK